ncbi:MAG: energy transducer TonB [Pyrinomonadaceae bacterium]
MKGIRPSLATRAIVKVNLSLLLILACVSALSAQSFNDMDADGLQRRVTRARSLAAAGNLPAARSELEALQRTAGVDPSVREITLVLLAGIYIDQSDYIYAEKLLNDAFHARATGGESATRAYFVLAGQVLSGVRAHLERYRVFGLDVADEGLPSEASGDLERVRTLIERIVAQGKELRDGNARNMDATALLEEAASVRVRLARKDNERAQWQREVTDARQRLMATNSRTVASTGTTIAPSARPQITSTPANASQPAAQPSPAPANTTPGTSSNDPATGNTQTASEPANTRSGNAAANASSNPSPAASSTDKAADGMPLEVGSLIPKAAQTIAPTYPATARNARVTGKVTVFLMVNEKGTVEAVKRTDGPELLRRAAEDAARRWKFRPTVVNGQPVRVSGFINFNFAL